MKCMPVEDEAAIRTVTEGFHAGNFVSVSGRLCASAASKNITAAMCQAEFGPSVSGSKGLRPWLEQWAVSPTVLFHIDKVRDTAVSDRAKRVHRFGDATGSTRRPPLRQMGFRKLHKRNGIVG